MNPTLFSWLWRTNLHASVLVLLVAALLFLFRKQIKAPWRHWLWLLVVVLLMLPGLPSSDFSVFNLIPAQMASTGTAPPAPLPNSQVEALPMKPAISIAVNEATVPIESAKILPSPVATPIPQKQQKASTPISWAK